jgi:hypothetical protein
MKKIHKNISGLIAFFVLLLSAFLLPLFNQAIFDKSLPNKSTTMANMAPEVLSNLKNYVSNSLGLYQLALVLTFILILLFYLVNGLGFVYNRFSRYASYLSFVYLILGLLLYNAINKKYGLELLGVSLTSISIGFGLWAVPLVAALYLIFSKELNKRI